MSWYPDLSNYTMVASGDHVRAIGWLASAEPFTQGEAPPEFVARLDEFVRLSRDSAAALLFPSFGGFHECDLCERSNDLRALGPRGYGNIGVPDGGVLYVAPNLVSHYVRVHHYLPPAEFIAAVQASPLPDTPEYRAAAEPFGLLNRQEWERQKQREIEAAARWARERGEAEGASEMKRPLFPLTPEAVERLRLLARQFRPPRLPASVEPEREGPKPPTEPGAAPDATSG